MPGECCGGMKGGCARGTGCRQDDTKVSERKVRASEQSRLTGGPGFVAWASLHRRELERGVILDLGSWTVARGSTTARDIRISEKLRLRESLKTHHSLQGRPRTLVETRLEEGSRRGSPAYPRREAVLSMRSLSPIEARPVL